MKWSTEAKVGLFSLLGILLFAGITIYLSHLVIFGKNGFMVTGYFKEAEGIEPGNPIHYAGVEVGIVDKIKVENGQAVITLRLYKDIKIPVDAEFNIQTNSVMGGRFVKVSGGHEEKGYLQEGMSIQGKAAPGFDQAIDKMDKLINSAQLMLDGINTIVADPNAQTGVKSSIANMDVVLQNLAVITTQGIETTRQVNEITAQINSMLKDLNGDGKVTKDVRTMMGNLAVASENAKEISANAKVISGKLSGIMGGNGEFHLDVSGEMLYNTKNDKFSPNLFLKIGGDSYGLFGIESMGNDSVYDAMFGKKKGDYDVHMGVIRNKLGIGTTYEQNRWKFSADLYDPNDLSLRLRGVYQINDNFFVTGQTILPHSNEGGGEYIGLGYTLK